MRKLRVAAATTMVIAISALGLEQRSGEPGVPLVGESATAGEPVDTEVASRPVLTRRPNFVMVLMDDASMDLLRTMRHAGEMARQGASYQKAFVVDSLCCVSRTSLLTGQYPHQTRVLTNTANLPNRHGPIGGWRAFEKYGNGERSFNVHLQDSGYTTGYVGKFLNEYQPVPGPRGWQLAGGPPGWSEWRPVTLAAYDGWGFSVAGLDGTLPYVEVPPVSATTAERDRGYSTSVIGQLALDFIRRHRHDHAPYFLTVATYGPHSSTGSRAYPGDPFFPPALADRPSPSRPTGNCGLVRCQSLTVDDLIGFGDRTADNIPVGDDGNRARNWRATDLVLSAPAAVAALRDRAQMVQSIDRLLGQIRDAVDPNTYVLLTSDNGFHLGQHRLWMGKATPYDSDVHVPLLITGPGVVPGVRQQMVSNIDLAPTLETLAGLDPPAFRSGISFASSLRHPGLDHPRPVFLEHTWAPSLGDDPDRWYAGGTIDHVPSYVAVRTPNALLVRFDLDNSWHGTEYAWEFYDYRDAPFERTNSITDPTKRPEVANLRRLLDRFLACQTAVGDDPVTPRCR